MVSHSGSASFDSSDYEDCVSLLIRAAISLSRPVAACWYLNDAAGVECPRRAISSASVAPVAAANDFPKWRPLIPTDDELVVVALIRRADLLTAVGAGDEVTLKL
jgi:hypothetical protein